MYRFRISTTRDQKDFTKQAALSGSFQIFRRAPPPFLYGSHSGYASFVNIRRSSHYADEVSFVV